MEIRKTSLVEKIKHPDPSTLSNATVGLAVIASVVEHTFDFSQSIGPKQFATAILVSLVLHPKIGTELKKLIKKSQNE